MAHPQMRQHISGAYALVELQGDHHGAVGAAGASIPLGGAQSHGRRGELKSERRAEASAGGTGGAGVHDHGVGGCVRERRGRVRREEQHRGARPPELSGDPWRDRHPRDGWIGRRSSERDHRLGKDEADFVGLRTRPDLSSRTCLEDGQGGVLCGACECERGAEQQDQAESAHAPNLSAGSALFLARFEVGREARL